MTIHVPIFFITLVKNTVNILGLPTCSLAAFLSDHTVLLVLYLMLGVNILHAIGISIGSQLFVDGATATRPNFAWGKLNTQFLNLNRSRVNRLV